jgi:hypothetical protein
MYTTFASKELITSEEPMPLKHYAQKETNKSKKIKIIRQKKHLFITQ